MYRKYRYRRVRKRVRIDMSYNLLTDMLMLLKKNGGKMLGEELYSELKKKHEISYRIFIKALMTLEIHGHIRVQRINDDFLIELVK